MTGTTPNQQYNGDPCDPATPASLKVFLDSVLFGDDPSTPPSVQIPAPAPGQRLVYADRDGRVWVLDADSDALTGGPLDPCEARDMAQRLWDAADVADGGE